ncbi:hypothetical protein J3A83DRAFT_1017781 [Scleroderma citrinum]
MANESPATDTIFLVYDKSQVTRTSTLGATTTSTNHPAGVELSVPDYGHQQCEVASSCEDMGASFLSSRLRGLQPQHTYTWKPDPARFSNSPSSKWGADSRALIWSVADSPMCPSDSQQSCMTEAYTWPLQATMPDTHAGYNGVDFGRILNPACSRLSPSTTVHTPPVIFSDGSMSAHSVSYPPVSSVHVFTGNDVICRGHSFPESNNQLPTFLDDTYIVPLQDLCDLVDMRFISKTHFFKCSFDDCVKWVSDDRDTLEHHLATHHGILLRGDSSLMVHCQWRGCGTQIKRGNFPRHLRKHLEDRWGCSLCGQDFSRRDSISNHAHLKAECSGAQPIRLISRKAYRAEVRGNEVVLRRALVM